MSSINTCGRKDRWCGSPIAPWWARPGARPSPAGSGGYSPPCCTARRPSPGPRPLWPRPCCARGPRWGGAPAGPAGRVLDSWPPGRPVRPADTVGTAHWAEPEPKADSLHQRAIFNGLSSRPFFSSFCSYNVLAAVIGFWKPNVWNSRSGYLYSYLLYL